MGRSRGEFDRRVLGRGPDGDEHVLADVRKLECGHTVPHAATISYNQETGAVTWDMYVHCPSCAKEGEQRE